jgi:VRR-NUC domain-containing protein
MTGLEKYRGHQTEQQIVNTICEYLTISHIPFARVRNTGAIIKKDDGRFFFGRQKFNQRGVSDIIACVSSVALAIEVKRKDGVVSPEQDNWILRWIKEGGKALVARSLDDVIQKINEIRNVAL